MGPAVCFLIIAMTTVSARHTLDVNKYLVQSQIDPNHSFDDRYGARDVDGRNDNSASDVSRSREHSYADAAVRPAHARQHNVDYTYATESDHVALISEKVDASNNIGNDENQFKLRTNAYPSTNLVVMEYSTESIRAHTNVEGEHSESQHRAQTDAGFSSRSHSHGGRRNSPRGQNHRSMTMDPEIRFIPQKPQLDQNGDQPSNTSDDKEADIAAENIERATETVNQSNARPSLRNRGGEDRVRLPKEKEEEEIPWVWGSEPAPKPKKNVTDTDDLDDRAAFDGSGCATGLVKVMGVCVEKH